MLVSRWETADGDDATTLTYLTVLGGSEDAARAGEDNDNGMADDEKTDQLIKLILARKSNMAAKMKSTSPKLPAPSADSELVGYHNPPGSAINVAVGGSCLSRSFSQPRATSYLMAHALEGRDELR